MLSTNEYLFTRSCKCNIKSDFLSHVVVSISKEARLKISKLQKLVIDNNLEYIPMRFAGLEVMNNLNPSCLYFFYSCLYVYKDEVVPEVSKPYEQSGIFRFESIPIRGDL